jgi:hemolysin activation/secretion protein
VPAQSAAPNLVSVVVRGSSIYDAPTLFAVYRDQLGKPITATGAQAIAAALIAKYEADGYSRPQVRLDNALLQAGVLRLDLLEPRIGEVRVNGNAGPHLDRLETLGTKLRDDGPITQAALAATLRQMRSLPGLTLQATAARDETSTNLYRLDLDAEFDRTSGALRVSNRGTDEAGPNFVLGQVMVNGLLGGHTNLGTMFGSATDYEEYHGLGLLASVGAAGGRLSFSGFRSRSNPHEPIVDRDDSYLRDLASIAFARPLPVVEGANLTLTAALDFDDLAILRSGERLRDERLRMLTIGPRWRWRHGRGADYFMGVDVVKGLDAMGSGLTAPDIADDPRRADFLLTRLTFTRLSRFGTGWSVRLDALGQHTPHTLPYGERFKIGGDRLGRGFEVAEIAGDSGLGAKVELRRNLVKTPRVLRGASLYGFYDIAAAFKQDAPGRESAATAGFGFAIQAGRVSSVVELAQPLTHPDVEGRKDLTLFAELALGF